MLKGHVFSKQLFGNPIFALFINTFLNGENGVSNNYKNAMEVNYAGNNITIQSGAVCIQGRFVEEDTSSTIPVGTDVAYCKLVIEIDLDKVNTESELNQVSYKIVKGASAYPNLIQTNIVKNNAGIYQYELARFRTTGSGITDFQDMRTFLDISSIFTQIRTNLNSLLSDLNTQFQTLFNTSENDLQDLVDQIQSELDQVEDESIYLLKTGGTANGDFNFGGNVMCNNLKNSNGSKVIYKDDFAIIEGVFQIAASTGTRVAQLAYPTGFNKDNCVVIAHGQYHNENVGYVFGHHSNTTIGMAYAANDGDVALSKDNIEIWYNNTLSMQTTINYKIVLMKIS